MDVHAVRDAVVEAGKRLDRLELDVNVLQRQCVCCACERLRAPASACSSLDFLPLFLERLERCFPLLLRAPLPSLRDASCFFLPVAIASPFAVLIFVTYSAALTGILRGTRGCNARHITYTIACASVVPTM